MHSRHIKFSPLNAHRSVPAGSGGGGLRLAISLHTTEYARCWASRRSRCAATTAQLYIPLDGRPLRIGRNISVCIHVAAISGRSGHRHGQLDAVPAQQSADQQHHNDQFHHQSESGCCRRRRHEQHQQQPQQFEFHQQLTIPQPGSSAAISGS